MSVEGAEDDWFQVIRLLRVFFPLGPLLGALDDLAELQFEEKRAISKL